MDLILLRHGIAHDTSSDGTDDARELTGEGKSRTHEVAQGLFKLIGQPELIFTSPKIRAMQTAEIFTNVSIQPQAKIAPLIAGPSVTEIKNFVLEQNCSSLLIVGHEPTLSALAEILCTGQATTGLFQMKKAGAICIDLPKNYRKATLPGTLQWLLPPAMLRRVGQNS